MQYPSLFCGTQYKRAIRALKRRRRLKKYFYRQRKFGCNSARFCAKPCERLTVQLPSVSDGMQHRENVCKRSSFNYKSAALPADRCWRRLREQCVVLELENPARMRKSPRSRCSHQAKICATPRFICVILGNILIFILTVQNSLHHS